MRGRWGEVMEGLEVERDKEESPFSNSHPTFFRFSEHKVFCFPPLCPSESSALRGSQPFVTFACLIGYQRHLGAPGVAPLCPSERTAVEIHRILCVSLFNSRGNLTTPQFFFNFRWQVLPASFYKNAGQFFELVRIFIKRSR